MLGGSYGWFLVLCLCAGETSARGRYRPSLEDFKADELFIQDKLNITDQMPDRLSNVTPEVFAEYFQAGKPLIVTDMITNWPMKDWTCETVSKDFADEPVIVWNYQDETKHKKWQKLRDIQQWQSADMKQPDEARRDKKGPQKLSYHWYPVQMGIPEDMEPEPLDPNGDDYHSTLASAKARKLIKDSYSMPYFVEPNPMNKEFTKERIEFFLGMKGSGAAVHADAVCEAIFSVQLAGVKRWRLSPLPPYTQAVQDRGVAFQPKGQNWQPQYTFDLQPGEAVFFPPSFMHETQCVSDECSLSASLQIRYPFPVGHIRDFSRRLMNSQEVSFCFEHWAPFVTGHKDGVREMYRQIYRGKSPETVVGEFFDLIDADKDGVATVAEKTSHFDKEIKEHKGQVEFMAPQEAKDWFMFNDVDRDGKVTRDEYLKTHLEIHKNYATAIEQGACDEDGCHENVKQNVLAGKLNGIDSAFIGNNKYNTDGSEEEDEGDDDRDEM